MLHGRCRIQDYYILASHIRMSPAPTRFLEIEGVILFLKARKSYFPPQRIVEWAGELVCGCRTPRKVKGLRKLRPQVELQSPRGHGESLGNRAETKRPLGLGDEACVMSSVPGGSVETAVLQVERANSRR